jgi:hypothetical protein
VCLAGDFRFLTFMIIDIKHLGERSWYDTILFLCQRRCLTFIMMSNICVSTRGMIQFKSIQFKTLLSN